MSEKFSYEEMLAFIKHSPANIFFKDTECKYRFVTEICEEVNGGPEHSIIGKTDLEIHTYPGIGQGYYEDDKRILATGQGSTMISRAEAGGKEIYWEIKKNPVYHDGKIIGIIGIVNDVTKTVHLEKELEELSFKDKLTGLYNRNYMESRDKTYVRGDDFPASLIMADCNYLKKVNDTLGHEYGDLLLKRIAQAIQEATPDGCIPMRVGGDEFLILCPKTPADKAEKLIAKIKQRFVEKSDDILTLDAAFGYYTASDDTLTFAEAFRRADQAMYKDKMASRKTRA